MGWFFYVVVIPVFIVLGACMCFLQFVHDYIVAIGIILLILAVVCGYSNTNRITAGIAFAFMVSPYYVFICKFIMQIEAMGLFNLILNVVFTIPICFGLYQMLLCWPWKYIKQEGEFIPRACMAGIIGNILAIAVPL